MSDNWWTDYAQNKRIRGLEEDLSYVSSSLSQARASQSRLKAELSKVSGSMEQRLNRLSAAFDAFVEISDLRVTLGLFDSHGRIRHQTKQLLAGSAATDVSDAEGYWLAPALVALRGIADGAVDADALALAVARDPLRTKVFHALLAAVHGGRQLSLSAALPALTDPVPMYQRALWLLAADGFAGPEGWDLVRERCASAVTGDELSDTVRSLAAPRTGGPSKEQGGKELAAALGACEKLTALRAWVAEALDRGAQAQAVDPLVRRSLDLLIDEGSPVELPLLARERELRAVIEGREAGMSTWDSPVGSAVELLREDLSSEHPGRRALAVRAAAPVVLSLASEFEAAARVEPPSSIEIRTHYGHVTISPTAPDQASLSKAVAMVDMVSRVESKRRPIAYGAAVTAVLFLVLTFVAGWGWVFVALGAAGVGLYQWLTDAKERREAAARAVELKQGLRDEVAEQVEEFAKTGRELRDRQVTVTEDMAALRAALATVTE
ncbi:hypothetical protein [Actinophytocola sp.]|uniref:hypothetical protein n=1 Tax=Actinophytocola sp. TaxID=1872138 RepID=UPI002ED1B9E6